MNNIDVNAAIKYFQDVVTNHYADFKGRVSRRDYWTYVAVYVVIAILASVIQGIVGLGIVALLQLGLLLPSAGMTARRLQDTGKNGQLVWLLFIPIGISSFVTFLAAMTIGGFGLLLLLPLMGLISLVAIVAAVYLIYLCVQPGTAGENQYGPDPLANTQTQPPAEPA